MKTSPKLVTGGALLLTAGPCMAIGADPSSGIDTGATAWMLASTTLVLLMVPGLAMFYGGLVRTKNVLGTMMHCYAAMAVIGVLWAVCGYAMAFGPNIGTGWLGMWCGWDSSLLFLSALDSQAIIDAENPIPPLVFAMFQGKFAIIAPALIAGAVAERIRFRAYCVFIALWVIFVYNPLCHWVWASDGWLYRMEAIDFAGGTVVHISAGITGLIAALYVGSRRGYPQSAMHANNMVMTLIGVGLLWVGWFGFNAGSSLQSGLKTAQALTATQIAAAAGALGWIIIEAMHLRKSTSLGLASGILAGLVVITPAAGVVQPAGAIILGFIASACCYMAINLKNKLGYDDTLDVFGIHGVAGIAGAILLSFFIRHGDMPQARTIVQQLGVQVLSVTVTIIYTTAVSIVLLVLVNKTMGFRIAETGEMAGLDHSLHGEHGYGLLDLN